MEGIATKQKVRLLSVAGAIGASDVVFREAKHE